MEDSEYTGWRVSWIVEEEEEMYCDVLFWRLERGSLEVSGWERSHISALHGAWESDVSMHKYPS